MSLSIIKRPEGYRIDNLGSIGATARNSSGTVNIYNNNIVTGLVTGNYVYIYSLLSAYNGYWYVTVVDAVSFSIREYPTATDVAFINSGPVTYYVSKRTEWWMGVHLPIVFKIKSTLWPVNTVDTPARTVSSFANDSGYVQLTLSAALVGSFNALDYISITGATTSAVNLPWQIITKTSTSVITINLIYDATYDFTSGQVLKYYNNYHASIKLYAGLNSSHLWASQKPYSNILTLAIIPDSNNLVQLNVAEFIKTKLEIISNNLQLDTLPNNIEFASQFYISLAETYDLADATTVTVKTYLSSYTSDQGNYEGFALNSKLPFKTRSSGFMMEYVYGGTANTLLKFLTNFSQPSLFPGNYFDIAWIMTGIIETTSTCIVQQTYLKGIVQGIQVTQVGSGANNLGIYRKSLTQIGTEDRQDVSLAQGSAVTAPSTWSNIAGFTNYNSKLATTVTITAMNGALNYAAQMPTSFLYYSSSTYSFNCNMNIFGAFIGFIRVIFTLYDTTGAIGGLALATAQHDFGASGSQDFTLTLAYTGSGSGHTAKFFFVEVLGFPMSGGTPQVTITFPVGQLLGSDLTGTISETKTINIDNTCVQDSNARYLTWLNNLGNFEYWNFTAFKTYGIDIGKINTQEKNIFTDYPDSVGEFANTLTSETKRTSNKRENVTSQNLTLATVDTIASIKTSPLVMILNSQYDQRLVLVDNQSFDIRKDGDKKWSVEFTIVYTDEIPSQEV